MPSCEHVLLTIYDHNRYGKCRVSRTKGLVLPQILSVVLTHENFRRAAMLSCTEADGCPAMALRSGR